MTQLEAKYNSRNSFQNWFMRTFRSKALDNERAEIAAHGTDEETIIKVWDDALQDSFPNRFLSSITHLQVFGIDSDPYGKELIRRDLEKNGVAKVRPLMKNIISNENAPTRLLYELLKQHWEENHDLPKVSSEDVDNIAKHKNLSDFGMDYLLEHGSINTNIHVIKSLRFLPNEELQLKYIRTGVPEYCDALLDYDRPRNMISGPQILALNSYRELLKNPDYTDRVLQKIPSLNTQNYYDSDELAELYLDAANLKDKKISKIVYQSLFQGFERERIEEIMQAASKNVFPAVRDEVARYSKNPDLLLKLSQDSSRGVCWSAIRNDNFPVDHLSVRSVATNEFPVAVAGKKNTPVETMEHLYLLNDGEVNRALIENPATPSHLVGRLAQAVLIDRRNNVLSKSMPDGQPDVVDCAMIIKHPNIESDTLDAVAKSMSLRNKAIVTAFLEQPKTPANVIDDIVRERLNAKGELNGLGYHGLNLALMNPNTSTATLDCILNQTSLKDYQLEKALENPNMSEATIERYLYNSNVKIQELAAKTLVSRREAAPHNVFAQTDLEGKNQEPTTKSISALINNSEGMWNNKPYDVTDIAKYGSGEIVLLRITNGENITAEFPVRDNKIQKGNQSFDIVTGKTEIVNLQEQVSESETQSKGPRMR